MARDVRPLSDIYVFTVKEIMSRGAIKAAFTRYKLYTQRARKVKRQWALRIEFTVR
jgi:hypothetical protein